MKTLLVLRHAKSSWKDASLSDHDRPLNKRGRRDAPRMGPLIDQEALLPDLIVSSTARRARATADAVAEAAGHDAEILATEDLYHADIPQFADVLAALDGDPATVMVVAHNPGIEDVVEAFGGRYERMPTAALAQIELPIEQWADLTPTTAGRLLAVWRPKELA